MFASTAGKAVYFDHAFGREISWGADVADGFDHEFLPGAASYDIAQNKRCPQLSERLDQFDPDVIQVYGYRRSLSRQAMYWARRRGRRVFMVADSELLAPRSRAVRTVKAAYVPVMLRLAHGFLTIGDENERYYRSYGIPASRMRRSPIPIDSNLINEALAERESRRGHLRRQWAVADDDFVLLTVGKSVARKSHPHVLRAVAQFPEQDRRRTVVVFAGGGPDTGDLEQESRALGVRCITAGFMPIPHLVSAYLAADALVHPSARDPHPLAVAEAVFSGLPIVVSDRVGSWGQTDDVRPNQNGLRYPYGDTAALASHLLELSRNDQLRSQMGIASRTIGQSRGLEASVSTYLDAVLETRATA
jgi:glycosyltransferase involved in cell wall biosynthesis